MELQELTFPLLASSLAKPHRPQQLLWCSPRPAVMSWQLGAGGTLNREGVSRGLWPPAHKLRE